MNNKIFAVLGMGLGLAVAPVSHAMTLGKNQFELYGKFRLSLDYDNSDLGNTPEDSSKGLVNHGYSLSTNTSVLGLRGNRKFNDDYTLIWQLEQNIDPDLPRNRGLGNRNTFAGFRTPFGTLRFGHIDTPFKTVSIRLTRYTTTVADPHAILGAGSRGRARVNLRANNAIRYDNAWLNHSLMMSLEYSTGQKSTPGVADNNDTRMYSGSLYWKRGGLFAGVGYVNWSKLYNNGDVSATDAGVNYRVDGWQVGAIYDHVQADTVVYLNRDAYGALINYNITPAFNLGAQWIHADASDVGNDSADQYSLVGTWKANPVLKLYAAATTTVNGANAAYGTAQYAHGDWVNTVPGGNPSSVSVGMAYAF